MENQEASTTMPAEVRVKDIKSFKSEYKGRYKIILDYITDLDTSITPEQRQLLFNQQIEKLKDEFIDERIAEYQSKSVVRKRRTKLRKNYSGPPKKRKTRYTESGHPELITYSVKLSYGKAKRIGVIHGGAKSFIYLSKSGKGSMEGEIESTYYWRPEFIERQSQDDWEDLYYAISNIDGMEWSKFLDDEDNLK